MSSNQSPAGFTAVTLYMIKQLDWRFMLLPPLLVFTIGYSVVQGYYLREKRLLELCGLAIIAYFF